jgi:ABC-2 type transport system ATP-binding protein
MTHNTSDYCGNAVSLDSVTKSYSEKEADRAVDGVSLDIESGSVVGILGPNGAGKTTLIKSILGVITPDDGTVHILGDRADKLGKRRYRYVSAMLEGARNIYWRMSLRENIRYFTGLQGIHPNNVREENIKLISRFGMTEKADEPVRNFSRGEKQRASLACVLAQRTPLTFLDEPTLGLDVQAAETLRSELRELTADDDRTVILNSHNMDVVEELCDRVVVLKNGRVIADGSVSSLIEAFDTQTYEIRLSEPVSDRARTVIAETATVSWYGDDKRFEATVGSSAKLYRLMDQLETEGLEVAEIETQDPDLEDAFLRVTETANEVSHAQ